jgi:5-methylcytosine-specific restriction endonuclease McrA
MGKFEFRKPFSTFVSPVFKRTPQIKNMVWAKTDGHCFYCKCTLLPWGTEQTSFTIDHVIPVRKGGDNSIENLVPACLHCNLSKGARLSPKQRVGNND